VRTRGGASFVQSGPWSRDEEADWCFLPPQDAQAARRAVVGWSSTSPFSFPSQPRKSRLPRILRRGSVVYHPACPALGWPTMLAWTLCLPFPPKDAAKLQHILLAPLPATMSDRPFPHTIDILNPLSAEVVSICDLDFIIQTDASRTKRHSQPHSVVIRPYHLCSWYGFPNLFPSLPVLRSSYRSLPAGGPRWSNYRDPHFPCATLSNCPVGVVQVANCANIICWVLLPSFALLIPMFGYINLMLQPAA
jgi:hypothetical protein